MTDSEVTRTHKIEGSGADGSIAAELGEYKYAEIHIRQYVNLVTTRLLNSVAGCLTEGTENYAKSGLAIT